MTAIERRQALLNTLDRLVWDTERSAYLPTSWTAKAAADAIGITPAAAERALLALEASGKVTSRRVRSGETLFKLLDRSESRGALTIN